MAKKISFTILAAAVLTFAVYVYFTRFLQMNESSWKIYNIPAKGKNVLIVGDGVGAHFLPEGSAYTFQDMSSAKETSAQTLEKLTTILSQAQPDIIILSSGAYESERGVSWGQIAESNEKLLKASVDSGAATLFIGVYPPKAGDNFPFSFRSNCKRFGAYLIDDLFAGHYAEDIDSTLSKVTGEQKTKLKNHILKVLDKLSK